MDMVWGKAHHRFLTWLGASSDGKRSTRPPKDSGYAAGGVQGAGAAADVGLFISYLTTTTKETWRHDKQH
jgi:hypothetical protein